MKPTSIRLWFDWFSQNDHEMWWKEITFIPPVGTAVVPFENTAEFRWEFAHDDIIVDSHVFMAEHSVLVVCTENRYDAMDIPPGFSEQMERAGWVKGDSSLWS